MALEAVKGRKTVNEIAQDSSVHPTQVWFMEEGFIGKCQESVGLKVGGFNRKLNPLIISKNA